MGTGLGCTLCGNNFGEFEIQMRIGTKLKIVYVCASCTQDKSVSEMFSQIKKGVGNGEP